MSARVATLLIGALILPALSCGRAPSDGRTFRVGTWRTAQTIQPFFYQRFMPEGSEVDVRPFTNPADQRLALLAGSLDMCGTTIAHAIQAASRDEPVVVVAALCNKCSALVVRADSDIEEPADLAGGRIGYVPGTMHEVLLRETLRRAGLSAEEDVRLTRVDFFDMGLALSRGDIDAFLSGEPFPTIAVREGYGRLLAYPYYGDTVGTINAGMLVRRSSVEEQPERVYALVKAHVRATQHLVANTDEWLTAAAEFGTERAVLDAAAPNMELAWDMDAGFVRRAAALGERMKALGIIETEPDYDALFDLSFVRRAKAVSGMP